MEETYNTRAIILKRTPYRESDLRLTIYTPSFGKKILVARGALKQGAKLPGHLEPLVLSDIMIIRGKRFDYIGSAQGKNFYLNIKSDLEKSKYASLILKTVDKYTREDDDFNPGLFYKFVDFLDTLEENNQIVSNDLLYISFLFKILFFLGFYPDFYKCVFCKREVKYDSLVFNVSNG
ncbi:DNA repair protein RecO, partial [bacterium]|nr:DNA repair protein RecO [bacterium]